MLGILLLIFYNTLHAAGFSTGLNFTATPLSGTIHVSCRDVSGSKQVTFNCRDVYLFPVDYDYFVGPYTDADQVTLSSVWEDGSERKKDSDYDGRKGQSRSSFNLWITTVFQRPLLDSGENKISWVLKKKKQVVDQGVFRVDVRRGEQLICSTRSYASGNMTDCQNQLTMCRRYFSDSNYCR